MTVHNVFIMMRPQQWVQTRVLDGEIPMLLETIAVWQMGKEKTKDLIGVIFKVAQIRKLEAKMLDIISMAILLFILIGLPLVLIIIGGNDKTEEEQKLEDEEQMKYLEKYQKKKENNKKKSRRECKWNKNYTLGNK